MILSMYLVVHVDYLHNSAKFNIYETKRKVKEEYFSKWKNKYSNQLTQNKINLRYI
jgi:hypothetical protein